MSKGGQARLGRRRAEQARWIERWRIEQLTLVRQVSDQIADVRDLDELSRRIANLILKTFDYYYVAIFTLEPGQDVLHFRSSAGPLEPDGEVENGPGPVSAAAGVSGATAISAVTSALLRVQVGEGMIGHTAESGEEILARDISREPLYRYMDALPKTRSEIALPLKIEDRVLGVLDVQSDKLNDFDETDLLVLRALAGNIASAIEGARLYGALRRRAEQLSAISEVSNAIASILDQERLMYEVVELIQKRFGYPFIHLFSVHPGRRKIFYEAGSGSRSQIYRDRRFSYNLDDPEGIIPWVARNVETVLANDVDAEPRYRPSPLPPDETRSELTVPLVFGENILGILDVQSDRLGAFGEEDRFLFEALADNIAIAMRNAYLYRSESWRRQVADSFREVAGLLSTDTGLDQMLDAILAELERNLPSDVASIWLLDEDGDENCPESEDAMLRLAAVHFAGADAQDAAKSGDAAQSGDVAQPAAFNRFANEQMETMHASAWIAEALKTDHPVIRSPESAFDPLGLSIGFPPDYSAIATPLRVGEQCLGLLILAHHESGRFGSEAKAMTAAFASYAAVAIENTRLFEAAHEQAWVSTVLLQVSDATQSLTNLNELLDTVAHITPMLAGVKACAVYMLDDDHSFVPAASSGLNPDQRVEFERWRFAPGDVPALDHLAATKEAVILHSAAEDPRLSAILLAGKDPGDLFEAELLILAPMAARGEVLGAFLIDYSNDHPGSQHLEEVFDERLSIIQGIAHQTATAVENIFLLKSQKEEAYVSVALLQVAQAIVSSTDLDETLGSIVRITPILVGVSRSIIYVWDSERQVFRPTQAYGIPRDEELRSYTRGEFPILEAAVEENGLIVYPLKEEESDSDLVPENWANFIPPDAEDVEDFLESEPCLLLAFPLSVKGEVLGVLLVEEPQATGFDRFGGSSSNLRLRGKRLEIITGISQQAALAIQNERLQQQTLERERLEREMQLAREIQLAFLPHRLLELPGWEMDVRWRTAREVGGDFYDFFELPGGRIGLVISDVADKGMPAALFMTLVRTLVRATVQEGDSTAEVLKRVNDLLAPDAQRGMFVTLVYAVLDLQTGKISYANAGHNPPFVLRGHNQEIERLEKGGMALGVQEGNVVLEKTTRLEPGDSLILYTDGITEAFSPTGEMYTEAGLRQAILQVSGNTGMEAVSAGDIAGQIDASVSAFIGDGLPSDDLTLLVLKRLKAQE